jgi:predicted ATPase
LLRRAFEGFRETRADLRHTIFVEALAEALIAVGRVGEGIATIRNALDESLSGEGYWRVPELTRLRGEFALCETLSTAEASAEKDFVAALELAGRQGARSWQLRAATSLARLWRQQGRTSEACNVVVPIYGSFSEGFDTADLKTAQALIESLQ